MESKAKRLYESGCQIADMSTRRRRNFKVQERVVRHLKKYSNCVGTSNVYFAIKHNIRSIGTMAHEWVMAHQVIDSIRHCNKAAMIAWQQVYKGRLGIALPDTVGSDAFFEDMKLAQPYDLARIFDGLRHDSGDWKEFTDKVIAFYNSLVINPLSKTIIFSDSLNVEIAIQIFNYCQGKIKCSFGIGTHFSNDYGRRSPALNIVIKLKRVLWNGRWVSVVKTSDSPTKAMGDRDALRVTAWTINGIPLAQTAGSEELEGICQEVLEVLRVLSNDGRISVGGEEVGNWAHICQLYANLEKAMKT